MTKKQMKRFNKMKRNFEAKEFYSNFAKQHGAELTDFKPINGDPFGDGVPRCICVYNCGK